jgi:DNA-binding transcriptional regulator YiaG
MAKKSRNIRNLAHLNRDRGYRFVDRDPILDEISRLITDSGLSAQTIAMRSGVTARTITNWQNGRTKKPQNLTVDHVLIALGYRRITQRA